MNDIKNVIEVAMNANFAVKRYEVESVEVGEVIKVNYYDKMLKVLDSCEFSF